MDQFSLIQASHSRRIRRKNEIKTKPQNRTPNSKLSMVIILIALIISWQLSFKASLIYVGVVAVGFLLMSCLSAFSSDGLAPNASKEEQSALFRKILSNYVTASIVGFSCFPLNLIGIVAALAFHFLTK
jgi:uncharacterized membrane protein